MKKISIGYFGDGPWAHNSLNKLLMDDSITIDFVCVRFDHRDPVLIQMAEKNNIDVLINENINSQYFLNLIKKYESDLFVSMSFNQIFKTAIINLPRYKTINCHAGKLPFYRGRNILNWVLINDEKEFGITAHYVDEGIDTGDIIVQKTFPITDTDDYGTLLTLAHSECASVLYEAVKKIQTDSVKTLKQESINKYGSYCGIRTTGDEKIDWNQSSREIFNFVRAICKPGPQARAFINEKEMKINHVRYFADYPKYKNTVGQVLGKTKDGFLVKTKDSVIEVIDYEYDGPVGIGERFL